MEKEIQDALDALTVRIDAQAETIAEQQEKIAAQDKLIAAQDKQIETQNSLIQNVKNSGSKEDAAPEKKAERAVLPTKTFKVDKKEYRFTAPTFHLPGDAAPMTAEAALENKEVLKGLVEAKAGIIEEVL